MLVEDGVEVGDFSIHRRALHALVLVEFLHIVTVEEAGDGVQRLLRGLKRLVDIGHKGNLAVQHVDHAVAAGAVRLADADALDIVRPRTRESHALLVQRIDALLHQTRYRVVVAGDVVLDELLPQPTVAQAVDGFIVEGAIGGRPNRIGLCRTEHLVIARLLQQRGKLREVRVTVDVLPERGVLRVEQCLVGIVVIRPVAA